MNADAGIAQNSSRPPIIDVTGVTKSFGHNTVVNDIAMRVEQGEIYGFLGPNGSGKTTFLRMLCGLLTPDSGQGTCMGYDVITQAEKIKPHVGYMAQRFSLYADLSVRENLSFFARIFGMTSRRKRVEESIERMGLGRYAKRLAGNLSGGWKQRLALAVCMLHDPKLLLLDEPTAGVDPMARRDFWDEVHKLTGQGITALITTHYMDEAERCHRLAYIAYGNLLTSGTVEEVVKGQGLATWEVSGPGLYELADELRRVPGLEQVVPFGNTLHVSGSDPELMGAELARFKDREGLDWRRTESSLEEVFISLMRGSLNNHDLNGRNTKRGGRDKG